MVLQSVVLPGAQTVTSAYGILTVETTPQLVTVTGRMLLAVRRVTVAAPQDSVLAGGLGLVVEPLPLPPQPDKVDARTAAANKRVKRFRMFYLISSIETPAGIRRGR